MSGNEALLHRALQRAVLLGPDRIALRQDDLAWTFAELDRWSSAFAASLRAGGIGPGDRVAIRMSNRPEFFVAVHGISRVGAASVLLSTAWKVAELRHALELTEPRAAVVDSLDDLLVSLVGRDRSFTVPAAPAGEVSFEEPELSPVSEALLVFSSGTTGMPKAVRHTHESIRHATVHWREALGLTEHDRFQITTPPSHILGLLNLLVAVDTGATVRLHLRFDVDRVLQSIETDRLTLEMVVAPIALALSNHPDLERYDLSSLRYLMWGATPVTPSVADTIERRTGVRTLAAYGASELPVLAANPVHRPDEWRLDSAGVAPNGVELRVVALDGDGIVAPGEVGHIEARSASAMIGYLPAEATADAFHDGWYRTGDVGQLDEHGWVQITDRSKEMIKVKGFQVAPTEIESVLLGHPAVLDCAVFGVPDEQMGEVPVAAVQLDPSSTVSPDDLIDTVAEALATYKHLHAVLLVDAVPRLPSGKALRRELRARWIDGTNPPA